MWLLSLLLGWLVGTTTTSTGQVKGHDETKQNKTKKQEFGACLLPTQYFLYYTTYTAMEKE